MDDWDRFRVTSRRIEEAQKWELVNRESVDFGCDIWERDRVSQTSLRLSFRLKQEYTEYSTTAQTGFTLTYTGNYFESLFCPYLNLVMVYHVLGVEHLLCFPVCLIPKWVHCTNTATTERDTWATFKSSLSECKSPDWNIIKLAEAGVAGWTGCCNLN